MKILIIDDSQIMRNINKNVLIENKIPEDSFLEAADGKEALQIAEQQKIDLFLVDWNMPHLSGVDFVKTIRNMDIYKDSPVIMVTSEAAKYMVMEAVKAGVSDYIIKPIQGRLFWDKISPYLTKIMTSN